jgi:hypothetical protein
VTMIRDVQSGRVHVRISLPGAAADVLERLGREWERSPEEVARMFLVDGLHGYRRVAKVLDSELRKGR